METNHTATISLDEVLTNVRNLFKRKGYEPNFNRKELQELLDNDFIVVNITLGVKQDNVVDGICFNHHFMKAVRSKEQLLGVFFSNVYSDDINQRISTIFQNLDDDSKNILTKRFKLDQPFENIPLCWPPGRKDYSFKQMHNILRPFSLKLLLSLKNSINDLNLNKDLRFKKILGMKLKDCGFSKRVIGESWKYNGSYTIQNALDNPESLPTRLGEKSLEELAIFKKLFKL